MIFTRRFFFILLAVQIIAGAKVAIALSKPPILILASDNHFGTYTAEILKTEGFNEFELLSVDDPRASLKYLQQFGLVILAEQQLTKSKTNMLRTWVFKGGNLIAFRPAKELMDIFGVRPGSATVSEGYISILGTGPGTGITTEALQFHGEADQVELKSTRVIATLQKEAKVTTADPAIVFNDYGRGHAIAFFYNLPQSIVFTRQGNYRHAGREMDGITGIRAMDLFTGGWVDTSKNTLNQADEQMRLLSHCIERLGSYTAPLPRFWYFPGSLNALITLNNDGEDSKEEEFNQQFSEVDAKGAKMTLYVKETGLISSRWINDWVKKGFEMAGHPDDTRQASNPDWQTMDSVYSDIIARLKNEYGIPQMLTTTNHWFVWCGKQPDGSPDFSAQAKIEEKHGIRLDCNYAHYDNGSTYGHFLGAAGLNQGNYTGSGLVMRFAAVEGKTINVFQQLNNVYDQQYMEHKDPDGYFNCFKGLLDRSLDDGVYSFISIKAHNNEYYFSRLPLMKALDYANSRQVPVWTQEKLLGFLKARDEAAFEDIRWAGNSLSFRITSSTAHSSSLAVMIPATYNSHKLHTALVNGENRPFVLKRIKGFEYALIPIAPGKGHKLVMSYQ
jgi:hypothetical protein